VVAGIDGEDVVVVEHGRLAEVFHLVLGSIL
jgi:hypothetical protein